MGLSVNFPQSVMYSRWLVVGLRLIKPSMAILYGWLQTAIFFILIFNGLMYSFYYKSKGYEIKKLKFLLVFVLSSSKVAIFWINDVQQD